MGNFMNRPKESYTVGLNLFTDIHEDEMKDFHCRVTTMDNWPLVPSNKWIKKRVDDISYPDGIHNICGIPWTGGKLLQVSNTSSCWTFSTTIDVEALHAIYVDLQ
ncbi:hypothetical protein L3X38_027082 [Prunus dulcis]|uniref:Uncharacterized protein n=1 Tax=Prunus dulcis TaxID=3755 RepID=A0AAD4VN52_PRUDU|nr:hypothetical protein L3X38_027082 [Prunus dulcis]